MKSNLNNYFENCKKRKKIAIRKQKIINNQRITNNTRESTIPYVPAYAGQKYTNYKYANDIREYTNPLQIYKLQITNK